MKNIEGIITAVVTPFDSDEQVDMPAFRQVINNVIEKGVHGIFPVGTTGEFFSLTHEEKKECMDVAVQEAAGRVFVMPNAGAITTREAVQLAQHAEKAGADCVSVITPFFLTPDDQELYDYFKEVCESVSIPVLAYNNPERTSVMLKAKTIAKLAHEVPNFVGIKDSTGDMTHVLEIIHSTPDDFKVIMGKDTLICTALMNGAAGAIAATSNIAPHLALGIYNAVQKGDFETAKRLQQELSPLRKIFTLGSYPVVMKEAMNMVGLPGGICRRPVQPLTENDRKILREVLAKAGLI